MASGRIRSRIRAALTGAAIVLPMFAVGIGSQPITASADYSRLISASGTTSLVDEPEGSDALQVPEFSGQSDGSLAGAQGGALINRSHTASTAGNGIAPAGQGNGTVAGSNPELNLTFDGLNHRQNRRASGGNQFSLEPPDQGLCASGGFVLETVNDVMRVYSTSGAALTAPKALNAFYKYAPSINRTTHVRGPFVTDPSCYFDPETQRWFHTVLTIEVNPTTGRFTGPNHLDTAVSQTADPRGTWTIYRLPVQDDGTQGTPDHLCTLSGPGTHGPCLGDYPHIGTDANGFFITTNEYSFFGPEFHGAQIYAFSKRAMALGLSVTARQFDTQGMDGGNNGFTLAPATSPGGQYETGAGGTEYLLSSNAADEAHGDGSAVGPRTSTQVLVWAVGHTSTLGTAHEALTLTHTTLATGQYAFPPQSDQKAGPTPLRDCLNNDACATNNVLGAPDPFREKEVGLDSSDTRMLQTTFATGQLWGALDTALAHTSKAKAGVEWFVIRPSVSATGGVSASTTNSGYLGLPDGNLIYPAIGVTAAGHGVMALTVVGGDRFPSAGYALIDANGPGTIHVAAEGVGPDDGFSGYKVFGNRPRWGDYGASAVVGNSVWIASEYINQSCDLDTALATGFSCGGTRTLLANWGTRVSLVTP